MATFLLFTLRRYFKESLTVMNNYCLGRFGTSATPLYLHRYYADCRTSCMDCALESIRECFAISEEVYGIQTSTKSLTSQEEPSLMPALAVYDALILIAGMALMPCACFIGFKCLHHASNSIKRDFNRPQVEEDVLGVRGRAEDSENLTGTVSMEFGCDHFLNCVYRDVEDDSEASRRVESAAWAT